MTTGRIKRAYFWTIKHSFNHLTLRMARSGWGNLRAAGRGVILRGAREYEIDRIEPYPTDAGLRAFALPLRLFLRATRRSEFRLLHVAA